MPVKINHKSVHSSARKKTPVKKQIMRGGKKVAAYTPLVKTLGPERMAMVESRLFNGESPVAIAKTIKGEWKLMLDHKLDSIKCSVGDYWRSNMKGKLAMLVDPNAPCLSDFADRVDVVDGLIALIKLQEVRVSKALRVEKKSDIFLNYKLRFEMQLLGNLYVQLAELQMDLGLLRKVPVQMQIEGMASRTQQLLEDAMKKSRRVDEAMVKAFAVLDGKFSVVPEDETQRKH